MFKFGGNKRPTGPNLQTYAATVEQILIALGIDAVQARLNTESGFGWSFNRGSAAIEVYISVQGTNGYIQVLSPLITLPQTNLLPLYRNLLELNLQLTNAAFGVFQDVVYIFSERSLDGLDAVEVNTLITQIAEYADELDDKLVDEFGGRLYGRI